MVSCGWMINSLIMCVIGMYVVTRPIVVEFGQINFMENEVREV